MRVRPFHHFAQSRKPVARGWLLPIVLNNTTTIEKVFLPMRLPMVFFGVTKPRDNQNISTHSFSLVLATEKIREIPLYTKCINTSGYLSIWSKLPLGAKYLYLLKVFTEFQRLNLMNAADKVIKSAFESDAVFQKTFSIVIKEDLNLTAIDFAKKANIPPSTLYKILSGNRDPNIKTLRQIVKTIRDINESDREDFIAVIAARSVLDNIVETKKKIAGRLVTIREYSATSMEEAIIAAVNAERDGAKALVCAPIVSPTIEKIINIPVTTIIPKDSLIDAIELALKKIG